MPRDPRTRPKRRRRASGPEAIFRSAGEGGLVVELGDRIDPEVNDRVHRLAREVKARLAADVVEVVPTYRSLLVRHDPLRTPRRELVRRVERLLLDLPARAAGEEAGTIARIPVCYGGDCGPDLEAVARNARLSPEEVIAIHSGAVYRVYMLGFTPGFPYLGGMSPRLAMPRLETPRQWLPAGSIGIAGEQTGIYPVESPGGWRLIGRTPLRLFDPDAEPPFLLAPGDRVRFERIGRGEFDAIAGGGA